MYVANPDCQEVCPACDVPLGQKLRYRFDLNRSDIMQHPGTARGGRPRCAGRRRCCARRRTASEERSECGTMTLILFLASSVAVGSRAAHAAHAASLPHGAPAGWAHSAGHCLGPPGCTARHCDCSSPPMQLAFEKCAPDSCYSKAMAACKANPKCKSFGITTKMGGAYETYSLNNWSFVPRVHGWG